jgi:hypothetical protein
MPFDYGLRLDNRERIANAWAKPIKAHKNQPVPIGNLIRLAREAKSRNASVLTHHKTASFLPYPGVEQGIGSMQAFNLKAAIAVACALSAAIVVAHSLVYLSIEPRSLSAEMPSQVLQRHDGRRPTLVRSQE